MMTRHLVEEEIQKEKKHCSRIVGARILDDIGAEKETMVVAIERKSLKYFDKWAVIIFRSGFSPYLPSFSENLVGSNDA